MDFDFSNFTASAEAQAEDTRLSKQATHDEIIARHTKALAIELQQQGGKLLVKPQAVRVAVNPVSQTEYDCRLHALLNIVRNPELAAERYPLSASWKVKYQHIPYNDKATNWKISKKDADTIIALMKQLGVYKRFKLDGVAAVVARMKEHYQTTRITELEERVQTLELMMGSNGSIWYKGVEIKRLARTFKVTLGDSELVTRHGTFDKMTEFLLTIDKLIA